jgi:hypothetical protein
VPRLVPQHPENLWDAAAYALQPHARMSATTDRRRLLDKLMRELVRSEAQAVEHAPREARRIGETAPVQALRDVAAHALSMRSRFDQVIDGHALHAIRTGGIGATLATLRHLVTERIHDSERAYRAALLDLRHGVDVVRVMREIARLEELFALIRWCDDWLATRRTLVARVEAQLAWFADQAFLPQEAQTSTVTDDTDPNGPPAFLDSH